MTRTHVTFVVATLLRNMLACTAESAEREHARSIEYHGSSRKRDVENTTTQALRPN